MQRKAWAFAVLLSTLPALPLSAGIYYSPVFNMPLQPAPSTFDGGFYTVMPNGVVYGPNYNLMPPFNPTSGFNTAFVGQRIFGKLFEEAVNGSSQDNSHGHGGGGGPPGQGGGPPPGQGGGGPGGGPGGPGGGPPPRQIGIGGYTLDYSDPETMKNFDATAPMINGYVPFGSGQPRPPQYYGNGPMPLPHYADYPRYPYPAYQPPPPYGCGYRPCGMISQGLGNGVYQAGCYAPGYYGYGPGYYGQGYYGPVGGGNGYYGGYSANSYYGGPIRQVQAAEQPYCPPPQYPQSQGSNFQSPYGQGCMPPAGGSLPNPTMPYVPMPSNPNYYMQQPCMPCTPTLPNPCYEPPPCQENPNLPRYFTNSVSRSPRDFFMWKEVEEDKARRARLPLTVPQ